VNQHLSHQLGLLSLAATGICSMIGALFYSVPFRVFFGGNSPDNITSGQQ